MTIPIVRHVGTAARTLWGDGALGQLPAELDRVGSQRVVAVVARSVAARSDLMGALGDTLGGRLIDVFSDVREHSPYPQVQMAADLLASLEADSVLAVGGGSAIVTARAATILACEKREIRELATQRGADGRLVSPRLSAEKIPNFILATTPSTAYAKAGAAVRDPETGERLALFDPKMRAQTVIFDPVFALTAPASLVSSASLNVMAMAVDGMQAVGENPLAEALLAQGLREVRDHLPRVTEDGADAQARIRLMLAALLVGQGSDFAGTGIAQALSHALGPRSTVANGVVEAMLLPHTASYNADVTGLSQVRIAETFRTHEQTGGLPALVSQYLAALGAPRTLREIGISKSVLDEVIEHTLDDWFITRVPKKVDRAALRNILESAW